MTYVCKFSAGAVLLFSLLSTTGMAQDAHQHEAQDTSTTTQANAAALVKTVRDATEKYKDVSVAVADGYALQFGCVSGEDFGAMGLHYVNANLVNGGVLDATRPQIVIYEAQPNGKLKLIGADFLLIQDAWDKAHAGPPELMGQLFHLFTSPNRFGLPAFYTLHVWAWKENPKGAFVNWHPNVSCQFFNGQNGQN